MSLPKKVVHEGGEHSRHFHVEDKLQQADRKIKCSRSTEVF